MNAPVSNQTRVHFDTGARVASTVAGELGRRVREARLRSGLSVPDYAIMLGVCPRVVAYWQAGRRLPSIPQLLRMSVVSGVPASWWLMPLDGQERALAWRGEAANAE
jgi:DNA-binding transcriptional regulator YiaG